MDDVGVIKPSVRSNKRAVVLKSVSYKNDVSGNNNSAVEPLSLLVDDVGSIRLGVLFSDG